MGTRIKNQFLSVFGNLKLNRKIQISLMMIIVPLFILFVVLFVSIYRTNVQYDQIIANASAAGSFSINFKEDFDYKIYLLIAGHSSFEDEDPYSTINDARKIVQQLIQNTSIMDNEQRARSIMKLLANLEKYVKNIEENKKIGGHYDDNIIIWENDVQLVTSLIQSTVLEYTYFETKGLEQVRLTMSSSFRKIALFSLIVFVSLVLIAIFLSVVIPNSIVKPIHHLNMVTNQVAKGDLTVRANIQRGAEVKNLGDSLNSMIVKIDHLLKAVIQDEANLREAELELLQAQINPHFLYNTLDTIMWLSESSKQGEVVNMVSSLSDFFRTSLSQGNGLVTLFEEERHIRSYLQIQQVRYQDILTYEIHFPENIKDSIIPKITLQPLVENALYHGIKNKRGMGKIVVSARCVDGNVILSVEDNGIGMSEERLNEVVKQLGNPGSSYGLYNVNERLRLKFGKGYGLSINSIYGEGTQIQVKIPFQESLIENVQ